MPKSQAIVLGFVAGGLAMLGGMGPSRASPVPAFPGAEGFGAKSVGGRGGRVIEVTNLRDSGPGSLRAAIDAKGPRIVVFRIGGDITLKSGLHVRNPNITLAGQSAPGGGITLRIDPSNGETPLLVWTHDVIIRYMRFRPGPPNRKNGGQNALYVRGGSRIIIDHCSISWAVDQNFATWREWDEPGMIRDVTVQWCIISEALNDSMHTKGPHSMGPLIGRKTATLSFHHNLLAHNDQRNPRLQCGTIDCVNNVIYNFGSYATWLFSQKEKKDMPLQLNYVGNRIKPGPSRKRNTPEIVISPGDPSRSQVYAYLKGNIGYNRKSDDVDEWAIVGNWSGPTRKRWNHRVEKRHDAPQVTTTSALEAYK